MKNLFFKADDVRKVVADALKATPDQRRATFAQLLDGGAYDDALKVDEAKAKEITEGLKPELHLVHDDGIYLMANAWFEGIAIAYAKGCDPRKDEDVWERSRELVGGDDFCEALPLDWFEAVLADDVEEVVLMISATQMRIGSRLKKGVRK